MSQRYKVEPGPEGGAMITDTTTGVTVQLTPGQADRVIMLALTEFSPAVGCCVCGQGYSAHPNVECESWRA